LNAPASAIYRPADWLTQFNWVEMFGNDRPVEVEIGCGKGGFLIWSARTFSDRNFLGVERQLDRLRRVDKKTQRAGLTNVRLLRIEAGYLVARLVRPESVAAYHVLFPDPWPKRRHHGRRLFSAAFVEEVSRTLAPAGYVNVATDHDEYEEWIRREMRVSRMFKEVPPVTLPVEARTEFERIFLATEKPIHRSRWQKCTTESARAN